MKTGGFPFRCEAAYKAYRKEATVLETIQKYAITDAAGKAALIQEIARAFTIERSDALCETVQVFDTFDWRVYREGCLLLRKGDAFILRSEGGETRAAAVWKKEAHPVFWWDFPEGHLVQVLKSVIGARALLPLGTAEITRQSMKIQNHDSKTVVFADFYELRPENPASARRVSFLVSRGVRGYEEDLRIFDTFIQAAGLAKEPVTILERILEGAERTPGDYTSKLSVRLEPQWSVLRAMLVIFRHLLRMIRVNEEGIRNDTDTEFLHDFRVTARRTRSALTLAKPFFPPEQGAWFMAAFAGLGKATSRLRDLDVYLMREKVYRSMIPKELHAGLKPLFQSVRIERKKAYRSVARDIDSGAWAALFAKWESFLDEWERKNEDPAGEPVLEMARRLVRKRFRKTLSAGGKITPGSQAQELHALRIQCKKLRYPLEFFSSLFPEEDMDLLIGLLKQVQDHLGRYNDIHVQQRILHDRLKQIQQSGPGKAVEAAAVGGLITRLSEEQKAARAGFEQAFTHFSRVADSKKIRTMFRHSQSEEF